MRSRILAVCCLAVLLLPVFTGLAAAFETVLYNRMPVAAGQALIAVAPRHSRAAAVRALSADGFRVIRASTPDGQVLSPASWLHDAKAGERFLVVEFDPARPIDEALAALAETPGIVAAAPNQVFYPAFVPNDPFYQSHQSYLREMYLEKAWDLSRGDQVKVAVVDTGYILEGLTDGVINLLDGYDFADNDDNVSDTIGHGTQVANVIAHATNNGIGAAGVAPGARILPCKVFRDGEEGALESDILAAVDWAVQQGAQVINMSLGGGGYDSFSAETMSDAVAANVVVVAASGNEGAGSVSYPAAYEGVIAVGSCDTHAIGDFPTRSSFSNYGDALDFVAPGNAIIGETDYGQGIGFYVASGTSLASPMFAGAAALLIDVAGDGYTVEGIRKVFQQTANRDPDAGWDDELGWGEINVQAAMEAISGPIPNDPPIVHIIAKPLAGAAPLTVTFTGGASDSDGSIASYLWSFSSGETYYLLQFDHTFTKPGEYTVYLTASDDSGESASDHVVITVTPGDDNADSKSDRGCGVAGGAGWADLAIMPALLAVWSLAMGRRRRRAAEKAGIS
ncbi:MAG: S8 family serine peptidase [Myxococcales bacterium]|nr:S8 family serine peptidase [Myxococcales bacterium]